MRYLTLSIIISVLTSCTSIISIEKSESPAKKITGEIYLLPALGKLGVKFSGPNPNQLFTKTLTTSLPKQFGEKIIFAAPTTDALIKNEVYKDFLFLTKLFEKTGFLNLEKIKKIGKALNAEVLIIPQILSVENVSWEFTGVFNYNFVLLKFSLYNVKEGIITASVKGNCYTLGSLSKAYLNGSEKIFEQLGKQ